MDGHPLSLADQSIRLICNRELLFCISAARDVAGGGEGFFGFGADPEVGVGFGECNLSIFSDYVDGGQG